MVPKQIQEESLSTENDNNGNLIICDLQIGEVTLRLLNIYAPNVDNPAFFQTIKHHIEDSPQMYTLMCGDLNLVLDPKMDSSNYINVNNPKSRDILLETTDMLNLCDIFREINPKLKRYTWRRKNPLKQARLDYAIGSKALLDIINSCKIAPGYRSDHSKVDIELSINPFIKGKGIWRFNCGLLKNMEYLQSVKKWIKGVKKQYAILIYQLDNLDLIDEQEIQFTVSDSTFLEVLLLTIRGKTIKFSSNLVRANKRQEELLIKEIAELEVQENEQTKDLLTKKTI